MQITRNITETGNGPSGLMTHIAMQLADESGSPVTWGEHVSEETYGEAPSTEGGGR